MRSTFVRLAESATTKHLDLRQASVALYPPIPRLPIEMRSLGDDYVKAEFRRHRETTNPVHIMGFLTQWKMYLDELPRDPSDSRSFKKLDPTVYEKMSAEQLGQLYEFMHATKEIWKPVNSEQAQSETKE
ncbi:ACN9-domain-containing protein [Suillus subaureus]|uniref:Succinate dehydrogenase assembly factor 3 n=1 Tax=Suillus subaureus TaxID=48587 RepID=A0A9P7EGX2_9AGAM|nr:ACN9-domain-containing protein [Suillus subaureus]KAG1820969.1 ACN9-domain-containing protein [Suillus subaureus]